MIKVSRVSGLNGWYRIKNSDKKKLIVDIEENYTSNMKVLSCGKLVSYEANTCVYVKDGFEIIQMPDKMCVRIGGKNYDYVFDGFPSFESKWYFCVLGINKGMSNMWLYEVEGSDMRENSHSKLKLIGCSVNELQSFTLDGYVGLVGGNLHLTNHKGNSTGSIVPCSRNICTEKT